MSHLPYPTPQTDPGVNDQLVPTHSLTDQAVDHTSEAEVQEEKKEARRKTKAQKKGKAKKKTPKKNIKKTKALKERSRYAALPPEQLLELQEKKRNAQKLRIEEIRQNDPERYEEIKAKGAENKAKSRALKEYVDTASILYPDDPKKIFSKKLIDQHDWKFGELITSLSLGTEITRALKVKSYDGKIDDNLGKPDPEGVNLRLTHECLANFSYLIFKLTGASEHSGNLHLIDAGCGSGNPNMVFS